MLFTMLLYHVTVEYMGCYRDAHQRAMTGQWTNGHDMTVEVCNLRCQDEVSTNSYEFNNSIHFLANVGTYLNESWYLP